jgi:hypothetical protein
MATSIGTKSSAIRTPTTEQDWSRRRIIRVVLWIAANIIAFNILFQLYKMVRRTFIQRGEAVGFEHADQIIRIEKALHLYFEIDLQRWVLQYDWLMTIFAYYYAAFMWLFYACCAVGMIFAPAKYLFWRRVFICSMVLALPWYALYPLAPPRFMTGEGFIDATNLYGPNYFSEKGLVAANRFAAMPSMHVGWTTIGAAILAVSLVRWRLGLILGIIHVTMMCLTVMVTGNHWWLDFVGGWVVVLAAFLVARLLPAELPWPWQRRAARERVPTGT